MDREWIKHYRKAFGNLIPQHDRSARVENLRRDHLNIRQPVLKKVILQKSIIKPNPILYVENLFIIGPELQSEFDNAITIQGQDATRA
jgi:hypothetical protein